MSKRDAGGSSLSSGDASKKRKLEASIRSLKGMEIDKVVGSGTFGVVFKAVITETGTRVALKKIKMEKETQGFPVTAIREIKILKALDHTNVVRLLSIVTYVPEDDDNEGATAGGSVNQESHGFAAGDVFMVFEFVDFDLSGLMKSPSVVLTEMHVKSFMKQLLEGVHYLHTNKILHRDIKGANLLVTRDNVLKIADWGLARSWRTPDQKMTTPVVTLWYRSPELILGRRNYGTEIDVWSIGCLFAELKTRTPILQGKDETHQLELIYQMCGTPTGEVADIYSAYPLSGKKEMVFERGYPNRLRRRFELFDKDALDLLEKLLDLNPHTRAKTEAALDADYFWQGERIPLPEQLPRFNIESANDMS